jgi:hypothetical protein
MGSGRLQNNFCLLSIQAGRAIAREWKVDDWSRFVRFCNPFVGGELFHDKYQCKDGESKTRFGLLCIKPADYSNGNLFDNDKTRLDKFELFPPKVTGAKSCHLPLSFTTKSKSSEQAKSCQNR